MKRRISSKAPRSPRTGSDFLARRLSSNSVSFREKSHEHSSPRQRAKKCQTQNSKLMPRDDSECRSATRPQTSRNSLDAQILLPAEVPPMVRVPEVGVEPTRPEGHWILSPARLPFRHSGQLFPRATRALPRRCSLPHPAAMVTTLPSVVRAELPRARSTARCAIFCVS